MIKGPFTFIVTSRGCPAGCKYCIKHVTYQNSVRVRSAENIVEELEYLGGLGHHQHPHVRRPLYGQPRPRRRHLCKLIIERGLKIRWTCNSRVDYVDEEMLRS